MRQFLPREVPKYEVLRGLARRYPQIDPGAVEAYLTLLRVASDVFDALEVHFSRHRISPGRFSVLMMVNVGPEEGMCASDIADKIGVSRATITGLVDGLERDGLIVRAGQAEDRRKTFVRLTPAGRKYAAAMLPDHFARTAKLMAGLSAGERKTLIRLLGKVRDGVPALVEPYGGGEALRRAK